MEKKNREEIQKRAREDEHMMSHVIEK